MAVGTLEAGHRGSSEPASIDQLGSAISHSDNTQTDQTASGEQPSREDRRRLLENGLADFTSRENAKLVERALDGFEHHPACQQCGDSFTPRKGSGGRPQRFCSAECRVAFHAKGQRSQRSPTYIAPSASPAVLDPGDQQSTQAAISEAEDEDPFSDAESLAAPEQAATVVYNNKAGELVIAQRRWPDDDVFIFIAPANIAGFLDKLCDVAGVPSYGGPK